MNNQFAPHSHCHQCGSKYAPEILGQEWPKRCTNNDCRNLQFVNPTPIGVMLQTVTDGHRFGILTPIRGHAPMAGFPGITGGFQEITDHSSEYAGAREAHEEVGYGLGMEQVDEDRLELLCSRSTGPFVPGRRQNLVFSVNPVPIHISAYDGFVPDAETSAIEFSWAPRVLSFPSHTYALARYFQRYHGMEVPEAYIHQPRTGTIVNERPIFNIPYHQPLLDEGAWHVEMEEGVEPIAVIRKDEKWIPLDE